MASLLHPVEVEGKFGYIDAEGNVVIAPQYDLAGGFHDGLAMVIEWDPDGGRDPKTGLDKQKVGFINNDGELVAPLRYDYARDFSEGRAAVLLRSVARSGFRARNVPSWSKCTRPEEPGVLNRSERPRILTQAGNHTVKVEPSPSRLSTSISPPWACTVLWLMNSPMPSPSGLVL